MDVISHGLAGALVAQSTGRRDRVFTAACVGAALLPDLDGVVGLAGRQLYFTHHRVILHSLPAVIAITGLLAFAFVRWRDGSFARVWLTFAAAALSHVLLDGVTSWGTVLFHPLSPHRFYLDLLFMFDLSLTAILGFTAVAVWRMPTRRRRVAVIGLFAALGYLGVCAAMNKYVEQRVAAVQTGPVEVLPQPWTPLSWAVFVPDAGGTWAGTATVFGPEPQLSFYPWPTDNPAVATARSTAAARQFLRFARFPAVTSELGDEGRRLHFRDLRFEFSGMERSNWYYGVTVQLDRGGHVIAAGFTNP